MLRLRAAALAVCLAAARAPAQLYGGTEGEGPVHYTADLDAVPPAHRAAAQLLSAPQPRPAPPPGPEPTVLRAGSGAPITVAARLNGIALTLVVDTGADRTVLSPSAIERAGFGGQSGRPVQIVGATGVTTAVLVTVPLLDVAGARIGPLAVIVHALPAAGRFEAIDGLLRSEEHTSELQSQSNLV